MSPVSIKWVMVMFGVCAGLALVAGGCGGAPTGGGGASGSASGNNQDELAGNDNEAGAALPDGNDEPGDVTAALAPRISAVDDETWIAGDPYAHAAPDLEQGTPPIEWSLSVGPDGLEMDPDTGVLTWDEPTAGEYEIIVVASGPGGVDTEQWSLSVASFDGPLAPPGGAGDGDNGNGNPDQPGDGGDGGEDGGGDAGNDNGNGNDGDTGIPDDEENDQGDDGNGNGNGNGNDNGNDNGGGTGGGGGGGGGGEDPPPVEPAIVRVSVGNAGQEANDECDRSTMSADGMLIAFSTEASNLVDGDTGGLRDVFLRNRAASTTVRISVGIGDTSPNEPSRDGVLSEDGSTMAFWSAASNIVTGDTNVAADIFVTDLASGTIGRVSISTLGTQANSDSQNPAISADGRYVAFESFADNLVGNDTNGVADVFVYDRVNETTQRVSVSSAGVEGDQDSGSPAISADGRFVAFASLSESLVAGDTNGASDVFLHDRDTGETTRVSVASNGDQGTAKSGFPRIAGADGRYVVFLSNAPNLADVDTNDAQDVFLHDRTTGETLLISSSMNGDSANASSGGADISADGLTVVFESQADDLVPGDDNGARDVFRASLTVGEIEMITVDPQGNAAEIGGLNARVSPDGRFILFESKSADLIVGDFNLSTDIFLLDRQP